MDIALQVWGGTFYLTNKVLLALSENKAPSVKRTFKISGWSAYILGVPAWVIVLLEKNNWIAASIEAGGVPAMLLGLYNAYHAENRKNIVFNRIVTVCTYASLLFGIGFSLYYHSGITSVSQILEIGVTLGFLLGSYFLAHRLSIGWVFFMVMNLSMASLMMLQDKYILMIQQLFSFSFVIYGYRQSLLHSRYKTAV